MRYRSLLLCCLALAACACLSLIAVEAVPIVAPVPIGMTLVAGALAVMIISAPSFRIKRVLRSDPNARVFRLFRMMWETGSVGFDPDAYSAKLSIGLRPRWFDLDRRDYHGSPFFILTLLGVRVHFARSYGGIYC